MTHHFKDGSEHPVAFTLRSLTSAEKKGLQLAKENCIQPEKVYNKLHGQEFAIAATLERTSLSALGPNP